MDDALAMIDASLEDLMTMTGGEVLLDKKDVWTVDKNILSMKGLYDRLAELVRGENKR